MPSSPPPASSLWSPRRLAHESGLASVYQTGPDAWLIILSRSCRMLSYGASALILALFFAELGFPDARIGLFMTLTLAGDVLLSLVLTQIADRVGRRRTLLFGSLLMVISGVVFALCENYWVLLGAAVVGVISATGGDFGPFRAIEESILSELTDKDSRADVLVWYVTLASLGSSIGTEVAGRVLDLLMDETADNDENAPKKGEMRKSTWYAHIGRDTLSVMAVLWFLLSVDSVADGMVSMSLTTYYIDQKFHPAKTVLGHVLSAAYFVSSLSTIFSGPLARYIGLVNTMVFTHIPSSTAVLLFPFPDGVVGTFALLLLRVGLNNMDQAPRAALIAAVVRPEERTAVMGITVLLRTLASVTGPSVTGILAGNDRFWVAFVVAGALRLAYDLGLFVMFINIKLHRHEVVEETATQEDEEEGGREGAR
ncbi:major facilitator superfamily domain-containing protein [Echria macrotheca]|uniref:Major facilitator superfamily domain-containing protein n=1 Tax=Echria macrotheca TaxID=438768 RepID=A0AAJ0B4K2_9PEZI|nr:major facilitator superfamily domain-containing protein [Echria macrotheca]